MEKTKAQKDEVIHAKHQSEHANFLTWGPKNIEGTSEGNFVHVISMFVSRPPFALENTGLPSIKKNKVDLIKGMLDLEVTTFIDWEVRRFMEGDNNSCIKFNPSKPSGKEKFTFGRRVLMVWRSFMITSTRPMTLRRKRRWVHKKNLQ